MHRYDGTSKQRTKCCDGCSHLLTITYHAGWGPITDEVCNQGVAFKRLYPVENPRECEYTHQECKAPGRTFEEIKYTLIRRAILWMKRRMREERGSYFHPLQLDLRLNDRRDFS